MRCIAFTNQKGGVGKTTTTANVGAGLARKGKRVLLVDLDAQAHLTLGLGIQANELAHSIFDLLKGDVELETVAVERPVPDAPYPLVVIPSSIELSAADVQLNARPGREMLLREVLSGIEADYILIDCPPNLGMLTVNAMVAATDVVLVAQVEYYAMQGMTNLLDSVDLVRRYYNKRLGVSGLVATLYDSRKNLNREVLDRLEAHFGEIIFKTMIRDTVALAEAPSHGKTIYEYNIRSHGAEDYEALTDEILERYG